MKRPDFKQTDPKKSDFIKNNPIPEIKEEDENKIVQIKDGRFEYVDAGDITANQKDIDAIKSLLAGDKYTFKFNDVIEETEDFTYNFEFESNGTRFNQMIYVYAQSSDGSGDDNYYLRYRTVDGKYIVVYDNGWINKGYQTFVTSKDNVQLYNVVKKIDSKSEELVAYKSVVNAINNISAIVFDTNHWKINENLYGLGDFTYDFDFESNGVSYKAMVYRQHKYGVDNPTYYLDYQRADDNTRVTVYNTYNNLGWDDDAYRNIIIKNAAVELPETIATRVEAQEELSTGAKTLVGAINELNGKDVNLSPYQPKVDNSLGTNDKTIVGAINELNVRPTFVAGYKNPDDQKWYEDPLFDKLLEAGVGNTLHLGGNYGLFVFDASLIDIDFSIDGTQVIFEFTANKLKQVLDFILPDTTKAEIKAWINEAENKMTALYNNINGWVEEHYDEIKNAHEETKDWVTDTYETVSNGVNEALDWIKDKGEDVVDWIGDKGEDLVEGVKDIYEWIENGGKKTEEKVDQIEDKVDQIKDSVNAKGELLENMLEPFLGTTWELFDTFDEPFDFTFFFKSNDELFIRMEGVINTNEYGTETYVIHYYKKYGECITVYSSAKSGGWFDEAYKTIIVENSRDINRELASISGVKWKICYPLPEYYKSSFRLNCDFVSAGVLYESINVLRASGIYADDPDMQKHDNDTIEYIRKADGVAVEVYRYNPYEKTGGWVNILYPEQLVHFSGYRSIVVLNPTDEINRTLRKIATKETEELKGSYVTLVGAINEIDSNIGDFAELETEEVATYATEDNKKTLVGAVNNVHRRMLAMQETIDELDEKIGEGVDTSNLQTKNDTTLKTKSKTIVGAINELNEKLTTYPTYKFSSGWEAQSGYGIFLVDYDIYIDGHRYQDMNNISIGYTYVEPTAAIGGVPSIPSPQANSIVIAKDRAYIPVDNSSSLKIVIKGGEQSTNTNLINWLETYGVLDDGEIDTSNLATLDKIDSIDTWYDEMEAVSDDGDGISWENQAAFLGEFGSLHECRISQKIPLVAGENVTFSYDEENNAIAINSTGGGSAENAALMVTVSTDYPTPMSAIITAIQEAGGDISKLTFVTLTGYINCNLAMSFAWRGGNYYRVECIDLDTLTRIYYAPTDNSVYDATSMRIGEFLDAGRPEEKEEMPQIRFTSVTSEWATNEGCGGFTGVNVVCDDDYPLYFNVEIVGGGALQVGDTLQLCTRRSFMGCEANGYRAKYKLRKFAEYEITDDDLKKRYLTVATHLAGDSVPTELYHDGKAVSGDPLSPIYIRIRRPKGDLQNNDSGKTVDASFSNIVTVWKIHYREAREIKIL